MDNVDSPFRGCYPFSIVIHFLQIGFMRKSPDFHSKEKRFYGTAALGEKGQIVIPHEARKKMKIKKGDRLLVFGAHEDMLVLTTLSHVEKIAAHLEQKLKKIDTLIKETS